MQGGGRGASTPGDWRSPGDWRLPGRRSPVQLPPRSQAHSETEPSGAAPGTGGAAVRGHELELLAWGERARCEAAGIIQFLPESSVQAWKLP